MKISENTELKSLNSFGVDARAARIVEWETADELAHFFADGIVGEWMILGGGNNILFTRDYPGTLLHPTSKGIEATGETEEKISVKAGAGVDWDDFVGWCIARGLWGAENLSGIPGTVGACPIQNIGAYGAEARSIIVSVECFDVESRTTITLTGDHCAFGYRDSVFKRSLKGRVIITAVNFSLWKEPRPNLCYNALEDEVTKLGGPALENIRRAVVNIRNSKLPDPRVTGNAGSFFKNPVVDDAVAHRIAAEYPGMPLYPAGMPGKTKLAAGWLIEQAGWKGRSEGRVGTDPKQALIVINLGGATGAEIVAFARRVQDGVREKFGVELETEVNIV